jgi:hypothetical protein
MPIRKLFHSSHSDEKGNEMNNKEENMYNEENKSEFIRDSNNEEALSLTLSQSPESYAKFKDGTI